MKRIHWTLVIGSAAVFWAVLLLLRGEAVSPRMFGPFSAVVGGVTLEVEVFKRWCWRWPLFRGWLVCRPDLSGLWKVAIRSTWKDEATGKPVAPIMAFLYVTQTYTTLNLRLMSEESASDSTAASITSQPNGGYLISVVYQNIPKAEVRDRSEIHYGGMIMQTQGALPSHVAGSYWTDRGSQGDIELLERKKLSAATYAEAVKGWGDS